LSGYPVIITKQSSTLDIVFHLQPSSTLRPAHFVISHHHSPHRYPPLWYDRYVPPQRNQFRQHQAGGANEIQIHFTLLHCDVTFGTSSAPKSFSSLVLLSPISVVLLASNFVSVQESYFNFTPNVIKISVRWTLEMV
jgi:hypothetical protein